MTSQVEYVRLKPATKTTRGLITISVRHLNVDVGMGQGVQLRPHLRRCSSRGRACARGFWQAALEQCLQAGDTSKSSGAEPCLGKKRQLCVTH